MKKMIYLMLVIISISLEIFIVYQLYEVKGLVKEYLTYEISYDLTESYYYKQNLLNEENYLEIINSNKDLIIYFCSENCEHCQKCNEMILAYLSSGYEEYCDVYFAKYDMVPDLFDSIYAIDSTPTMLLVNNTSIKSKAIGFDECFTLMDSVVENMVPKN